MTNLSILDLLRSDGSIVVNKKLAHTIGLNEAVIYSELVSLYKYWADREELTEDGWFFCTIDDLEEHTSLKRDTQSRAIGKLEKKWKLIETKRMGLPARRYFKITDEILNMISHKITQKPQTDSDKGLEGSEDEKRGSNPHSDQTPQKPQTGLQKLRKLESAKPVSNNTRTNNTDLRTEEEEEENINNIVSENDFFQNLGNYLHEKEIPDQTIQTIIMKLHKAKVTTFAMINVEEQYENMMNKIAKGKTIFDFAEYFATGLKDKTDQNKSFQKNQKEKAEKEKKRQERLKNKPKKPDFNWLKDETDSSEQKLS